MPHYAEGTAARIGDVVVGKGYNRKGTCVGVVKDVRAGESCTLTIDLAVEIIDDGETRRIVVRHPGGVEEYGDTKGFRLLV